MSDKDQSLLDRYLSTHKGRIIVAALMEVPSKLCRLTYKDGEIYYEINGQLMNLEQVNLWKQDQQKEHKLKMMKNFNLTEDDFELSEEKLKRIIFEETTSKLRNIEIVGVGNTPESQELIENVIKYQCKIKEI